MNYSKGIERWRFFKLDFEIRIKKVRISIGITQRQLSIKAGLSQGYIAKLESPYRSKSPTLNTVLKIAKVLKVCPYSLVICNSDCDNCNLKQ